MGALTSPGNQVKRTPTAKPVNCEVRIESEYLVQIAELGQRDKGRVRKAHWNIRIFLHQGSNALNGRARQIDKDECASLMHRP